MNPRHIKHSDEQPLNDFDMQVLAMLAKLRAKPKEMSVDLAMCKRVMTNRTIKGSYYS